VTVSASTDAVVSVRPAVRADLLEIFRIERRVFPQPWPLPAFERHVGEPGFLVAVDEGAVGAPGGDGVVSGGVVGYVVADCIPNHGQPLGHVKDLAVRPDYQGRGIGSTLLDRALTALAAQDVASVKLEVRRSNEPAISLYRRFGFQWLKTVPGYYADGEDAYVLVRELADRQGF